MWLGVIAKATQKLLHPIIFIHRKKKYGLYFESKGIEKLAPWVSW